MGAKKADPAATVVLVEEHPQKGDRAVHVIYVARPDETDGKVARAIDVAAVFAERTGNPVRVDCTVLGQSTTTLERVA